MLRNKPTKHAQNYGIYQYAARILVLHKVSKFFPGIATQFTISTQQLWNVPGTWVIFQTDLCIIQSIFLSEALLTCSPYSRLIGGSPDGNITYIILQGKTLWRVVLQRFTWKLENITVSEPNPVQTTSQILSGGREWGSDWRSRGNWTGSLTQRGKQADSHYDVVAADRKQCADQELGDDRPNQHRRTQTCRYWTHTGPWGYCRKIRI